MLRGSWLKKLRLRKFHLYSVTTAISHVLAGSGFRRLGLNVTDGLNLSDFEGLMKQAESGFPFAPFDLVPN